MWFTLLMYFWKKNVRPKYSEFWWFSFKFMNSPKHRVIVNITIHYCLDDDDIIKTFFFFNFFISFKKSRSQHQHNFLRYFLINQFFFGLGSVENNQLLLGLHTWKPPQAYFRCIMALWAWQVQKVACTNSIPPLSISFKLFFLSRYC